MCPERRRSVDVDRGSKGSRGSGRDLGPEECQTWPKDSGAGRKPEGVWELEDLVANESQDPESASESGRRVRDVGSEVGQIGPAAAAAGCLRH